GPWPRARARRARRAAGRTRRRRVLPLSPLERLLSDFDLVALAGAGGLEDRLQLGRRRWTPGDAESTLCAEDAICAPLRLRTIDEIVDELGLVLRRHHVLVGHELEERTLQLVDARAGRGGH